MNSILMVGSDSLLDGELDLVEEMRLRTWARRNYVAACEREESWHTVILDEMARMDDEERPE
jgi:hypothetical protein